MAMDELTKQAAKAGLVSGAVGAAVPLAISGVAALTPQAIEQRKFDRKMRQDAIRTLEHGKKHGFGPSAAKRTQQVTRRMRDYDRQMAPAQDTLARQESLLGLGRSGTVQEQRGQLAEARGNALGQTRSMVEEEARQIGRQREAQAYANLNQERAVQAANVQRQRDLAQSAGSGAVQMGMKAYQGERDRQAAEANNKILIAAMQAATGTPKDEQEVITNG